MPGEASTGRTDRGLTVGLILLVTILATDTLAVVAAMPIVEAELGGRGLYGAVFSAFVLAEVVSIVMTGHQVGRRPHHHLLLFGVSVFAAGLVGAAVSTSMAMLVATRAVQGFGAGVLGTVSYGMVGLAFDDARRPRILAALSTAWVAPALVAPAGAAWVAEHLHWRWVFAGLLPLVAVATALTYLPMSRVEAVEPNGDRTAGTRNAVLLALGIALLQTGLSRPEPWIMLPVGAAGLWAVIRGLGRLLPSGSLTARGPIGGTMATKLLISTVFIGTDAFIPLALTDIHGASATAAGLTLTIGALAWTVGSWTVARRDGVWPERRMAVSGALILGAATGVLLATLDGSLPGVGLALVAWTVGGFGIGLAFGVVNVVAYRESTDAEAGHISMSLQLGDIVGAALGTGLGGALVALGSEQGWSTGRALLIWWGFLAVAALAGAPLVTRHIPDRPAPRSVPVSAS